jgi:two-component system KDP operon response regulator KdpE
MPAIPPPEIRADDALRDTMNTEDEIAQGPKVLVVEDEQEIRRFLRASLVNNGYRWFEAATGNEGLAIASRERPALVLLDLGLPDVDGLTVIRKLRAWSQVPIVVLSARGNETDKIKALDCGADDYLTKPFGVGELMARIRVALRRAPDELAAPGAPPYSLGNLRVDFERHQVFVRDQEVHLTPIEYRLLTTLIRHAGKLLTHRQLLKEVWGPDSVFEKHYLRVYMAHLRRKIEADPARPRYLLTESGIGYRLASDEASPPELSQP